LAPVRESAETHKSILTVARPPQNVQAGETLSVDNILQINIRRAPDAPVPAPAIAPEPKTPPREAVAEPGKSPAGKDEPSPTSAAPAESAEPAPKQSLREAGVAVAAIPNTGNKGPEPSVQGSTLQTGPPQVATAKNQDGAALAAPAGGFAPETRPKAEVRPAAQPTHIPAPETELPRNDSAQPLRSLALEFTPDGAGDLRLRLSERGGEVHVSLHSSDPSWSGRLHEGIHELVGSLATAGYDAEAWTPSQGQQQQHRQPEDNPGNRKQNGTGGETGQFAGLFQQTSEEIP
jgi:hypothetical protein